MGKSGSGGGSTTQKASPWKAQQPYLKSVMARAKENYYAGQLAPAYYSGQTVAGMDTATSKALALQEQRALAGNAGMRTAQGQLADTMSGKYMNNTPFSTKAANPFANAANPFASTANPFAGTANPFTTSANPFANEANPFAKTDGNPQLDAMVKRAIGQSNAGVNSGFAGAGRYGSGAQAAALNDAAGNISTQMYGQAYDQDMNRALESWNSSQNREMQAWEGNEGREYGAWNENLNRNMESWNANQNRNLAAWEGNEGREYGAWSDNMNRALSAYNTERENQIRGMMFAPQLAAADYQDIASLSEVGTARENYSQDKLNAAMEKYNYNANRPATALQNYANLVQGNYGMSGTSTSTAKQAKSNPLGGTLSGAASGAAIGSMGGPWGTAIGAGVGGIAGLLGGL